MPADGAPRDDGARCCQKRRRRSGFYRAMPSVSKRAQALGDLRFCRVRRAGSAEILPSGPCNLSR